MKNCPLQLDIVERIINRYSNEGDTVLDPFGGLMTVPYMAVKMDRKGVGIELNADYFRDGLGYLETAQSSDMITTTLKTRKSKSKYWLSCTPCQEARFLAC